jgi:thiol-disulfide isomerase/thioredoxin
MKHAIVLTIAALLLGWAAPADAQDSVAAGLPAPTFFLPALDGSKFFLSDHIAPQGRKVVVLDFFTTWCQPCKKELPLLDALVRTYPQDSVLLALVDVGEKRDTVLAFGDAARYGWPVLLDQFRAISEKYGVNSFPSLFIIDGDGILRYAATGFEERAGLRDVTKALDAVVHHKPIKTKLKGKKPRKVTNAGK